MMEKVAILMSTYNGEKFISEQIASLEKQTFSNWKLYVRDDGSTDRTIEIVKKYCREDRRIKLIEDNKNLKPTRSFLALLNMVDADYYFFCDQDDYWLKDKLTLMLNRIKEYDNSLPQVVYCNLKCVDSDLVPQKYNFENLIGKIYGKNRFIGNDMPGCVMLFNKATKDLSQKYKPDYDNIIMHDWWIALIAQTFGQVHFLDKKLIYYRQHDDNAVGAGKSGSVLKKLFQKDLIKKQKKLVQKTFVQDMEFRKTFYNILPLPTKVLLNNMYKSACGGALERFSFICKSKLHQQSGIRSFAYDYAFIFLFKSSIQSK